MPLDIFSGFFVGLSSGISCLGVCAPYLVPFLLSEKRQIKQNIFIILEFLGGRLITYLFIGLLSGLAGVALSQFVISNKITGILMTMTGIILLLYSLGVVNLVKVYPLKNIILRVPFSAGVVSGLNMCPPFITAVAYAISFQNVFIAVIYFLIFFLATAVYMIPFIFFGFISKYEVVRNAGRISGILVAVFVIIRGILMIL